MHTLSKKEKEVYDYICATIEENGYSPSVRDIRDNLGIKSTSTVHSYLGKLEEKGYIRKEDGKSRTLTLEGGVKSPKNKNRIPILAHISPTHRDPLGQHFLPNMQLCTVRNPLLLPR